MDKRFAKIWLREVKIQFRVYYMKQMQNADFWPMIKTIPPPDENWWNFNTL